MSAEVAQSNRDGAHHCPSLSQVYPSRFQLKLMFSVRSPHTHCRSPFDAHHDHSPSEAYNCLSPPEANHRRSPVKDHYCCSSSKAHHCHCSFPHDANDVVCLKLTHQDCYCWSVTITVVLQIKLTTLAVRLNYCQSQS